VKLFTISIRKRNFNQFDRLFSDLVETLKKTLTLEAKYLTNYIITQYMSGASGAKRRTGSLSRNTLAAPAITMPGILGATTVVSAVMIGRGVPYAGVIVGLRGQKTTIRAKNRGALTVPLPSAMTAQGLVKEPYRSMKGSLWNLSGQRTGAGGMRLFRGGWSKKSKLRPDVLYLSRVTTEKGFTRSKVIPMFVLRRSVQVPVQIPLDDIATLQAPYVRQSVEAAINDLIQKRTK